MKRVFMKMVVAAFALTLAAASVAAQTMGGGGMGGGGRKQHQQKAEDTAAQKPKVDEKAYSAALKSLANKQYDPWHGVR